MHNAKPGSPSRTYLRRGRCFASARRQASRQTAAYPSVPVPGHNVGRAFTPAAAALRHHTAPQTAACVDLQYAPAAPSPLSRHTRFRPPPPAASPQSLPCKGRCRRRRRRGAAPRPANTFPARRTRSPATYLRRARCFASPRRQTSRQTAAYPSLPVPGHNVGRAFTPAAAPLRHHTPPQTSKASPARGGAAAGGGGVPHLVPPIPFRLAAHAPRHIPAQGPMLCICPPPNLAANCRLSVAARSRPQCRAGVHARRSSLASPHSAANRRLRRFTICPRRTLPPFPAIPASAAPPPPPQAAEGCRTSPRQYPSGSQHSPVIAHPVQAPDALPPASPFPAAKQKPRPGFSPDRDLRVSFSIVSAAAPAWFAAFYRVTPRRPAPAG